MIIAANSFIVILLLLELILATGILDAHPAWTPLIYQKLNRAINSENYKFASDNPYRFNDVVHSFQKPVGSFRIAVLGDSYIWGDGLHREDIWSHKLAAKLHTLSPNIEVLHWGRNGWGAMEQLNFFHKEGVKFEIDLLVIAFVSNDVDFKIHARKKISSEQAVWTKPFSKIFPESINFLSSFLRKFFSNASGVGSDWFEKLYSDENLKHFSESVKVLRELCVQSGVPLVYVLTPRNHDPVFGQRFAKIEAILKEQNIAYMNFYPEVAKRFAGRSYLEVAANRANYHPGPDLTESFAEQMFQGLKGFIPLTNFLESDTQDDDA